MSANGHNGHALVVGGGGLGGYATQLAGAPPPRRLDRDELRGWMLDKSDPARKKDQCVCFALSHDSDEGRGRTSICFHIIPSGPKVKQQEREEAIDKAIAEIDLSSYNFAAVYPRMQRFFVGASTTPDPGAHAITEYPFLVTPPVDVASQFHQRGGDEETNLPAVVGHFQRLLDRAFGLLAANLQQDKDRLTEENRYLRDRDERITEKVHAYAVKCEELLDQHALRTVQVEKARADMALTNELKLELVRFLMKFGKSYVRAKFGGDPAAQDGKIISSLKKIAPPHLLKLASVLNELPEDQRGDLDDVFGAIIEDMDPEARSKMVALMAEENAKIEAAEAAAAASAAAATGGKVGP